MNDLRSAVEKARKAEERATRACKDALDAQAESMNALVLAVRDVGWRYKEIEALIAERDSLAQQVQAAGREVSA